MAHKMRARKEKKKKTKVKERWEETKVIYAERRKLVPFNDNLIL